MAKMHWIPIARICSCGFYQRTNTTITLEKSAKGTHSSNLHEERRLHRQLDATTLELAREIQISHPRLEFQTSKSVRGHRTPIYWQMHFGRNPSWWGQRHNVQVRFSFRFEIVRNYCDKQVLLYRIMSWIGDSNWQD
jgi:hypothetical protein